MNLQPFRHAFGCLIIGLAVLYTPAIPALESLGFTDLNKRVEQIEKKDAYALPTEDLIKKIDEVSEDVEAYIRENPDNVDALVLSVRLGFVEDVFVNSVSREDNDILIDPESKFAELHERLDRAIEMHPDYAAAYYWKAALYGTNSDFMDADGNVQQKPIDLQKAIQFAKQAVKHDEKNSWYRQTLAIYLVTAGERKSALEVLDTPDMENNAVTILLRDMENFPLPYGTIFSQQDTDSYIELLAEQKSLKNYPTLRVRVYIVPLSVEEMTRFYRTKWPNFTFFGQGRSDLFAQYMLPRGDELRPSAHIGEARAWASQQMGSIILSVQEVKNASDAQRIETPSGFKLPSNLGENFSYLFYANDRNVK